jgi:2-oxo-4-hydroxy-4-carboxy-5-ureidoimidazoline decarboxylase
MSGPLSIDAVNGLSGTAFTTAFGGIAEHSAWVAERAALDRPYSGREAMVRAFQQAVLAAEPERQRALLDAHPDLAGRAAVAGELTAESTSEQAGAGLDRLTAGEFDRFTALNAAYRARFGFPFIFAVRGATKHQILESFAARVGGTQEEERLTALAQVLRILRFRLEDRVAG